MRNCLNCGKELKSSDMYCGFCGSKYRNKNYYIFLKVISSILLALIFIMMLLILILIVR